MEMIGKGVNSRMELDDDMNSVLYEAERVCQVLMVGYTEVAIC